MDIEWQTYSKKDFSGGMSDLLFDPRPNCYSLAKNLLINIEGHLVQRPGCSLHVNYAGALGSTNNEAFIIPVSASTGKTFLTCSFVTSGMLTASTFNYLNPTPSFTLTTQPSSTTRGKVAYGNGVFIAIPSSGSGFSRSTNNGATWANVEVESLAWSGIAYGNSTWVAVARNSNKVATSTDDGASWSVAEVGTSASDWRDLAFGNGRFVAVGRGTTDYIMVSADNGASWTAYAAPEANYWNSVTYAGSYWVAVASGGAGSNRVMRASGTATSWSIPTNNGIPATAVYGVGYGDSILIATSDTKLYKSTDYGATWTQLSASVSYAMGEPVYCNGIWFLPSGAGGSFYYSIDNLVTCSTVSAGAGVGAYAVAYGNGYTVVVGTTDKSSYYAHTQAAPIQFGGSSYLPFGSQASGSHGDFDHCVWKNHLLVANNDGYPVFIIKSSDSPVTYTGFTAGLPAVEEPANYVDATVLASAISLANDLKAKMILHFASTTANVSTTVLSGTTMSNYTVTVSSTSGLVPGMKVTGTGFPSSCLVAKIVSATQLLIQQKATGAGPTTATFENKGLHAAADTVSDACISGVADATDLASLLTLVSALMDAYSNHYADAATGTKGLKGTTVYHAARNGGAGGPSSYPLDGTSYRSRAYTTYPEAIVPTSIKPTTLVEAAEVLNEIRDKYVWHITAPFATHYDYSVLGATAKIQNSPTAASVGIVDTGPRSTEKYQHLCYVATLMKTLFNTHVTSDHTISAVAVSDYFNYILSDDAISISDYTGYAPEKLLQLVQELLVNVYYHVYDSTLVTRLFHKNQSSITLTTLRDAIDIPLADPYDYSEMANKLALCITVLQEHGEIAGGHESGYISNLAEGFDNMPVDFSELTPDNYVYAFTYKYTYTVDGIEYAMYGPVIYRSATAVLPFPYGGTEITNIPALSATDRFYASSTFTKEIYRTAKNGTTFYKVTAIADNVTSYTDTMSDTELVTQETLYKTSGVVDYDPVPKCRRVHYMDGGVLWIGDVYDGSQRLANRGMQSIPGAPYSVPATFSFDLASDILDITSVRDIPIYICEKHIYRIQGQLTASGGGAVVPISLGNFPGAAPLPCPVQIPNGVIFAGIDGLYFTDGYNVQKITSSMETTYLAAAGSGSIVYGFYSGAYLPNYNVVLFYGGGTTYKYLAVHLDNGISESVPCTVWSGISGMFTLDSLSAIFGSWAYLSDDFIYRISSGKVYKHAATNLYDTSASGVATQIPWEFQDTNVNMGTLTNKKFAPEVRVVCNNTAAKLNVDIKLSHDNRSASDDVSGTSIAHNTTPYGVISKNCRAPVASHRFLSRKVKITPSSLADITTEKFQLVEISIPFTIMNDKPPGPGAT